MVNNPKTKPKKSLSVIPQIPLGVITIKTFLRLQKLPIHSQRYTYTFPFFFFLNH